MAFPLIPLIAAGASVVGSWINSRNQNKNADKQISVSREENEKARAHNLMLAELQNKWNVEQWAKENEYNSPSAQMARYAAAGLNPNLIYGQSNTSAQLSGSLSSGAPASPADMSAYGRKGSPVGKALENLDPFMYEQLRGMQLENDKKQADLNNQNLDSEFNKWLKTVDPYTNDDSPFAKSIAGRRAWLEYHNLVLDNDIRDVDLSIREFDESFKRQSSQYLLRKMSSEANISEEQAKVIVEQLALNLGILRSDSIIKEFDANMSSPEVFDNLKKYGVDWLPTAVKLIYMLINK